MNVTDMYNLGLILIIVSLIFAWILVLFKYILKIDESKVNTHYITKAHIDYLLMGILLLVFSIIDTQASELFILLTCIGAITNPLLFVVMAFAPKVNKDSTSFFGILSTISFLITTVGFSALCFTYLKL